MRNWALLCWWCVLLPAVGGAQVDRAKIDSISVRFPDTANGYPESRIAPTTILRLHPPRPSAYTTNVDSLGRLPVTGLRMADALISFPGLAVNDYGGHGSLQTLSARGMGSQHTAVSMNGVPVENAQTGSIDLGGIYLNGLSGASLNQTPGAIAQPPGTAELNLNYRPIYDQWQVKAGAGGFGEWLGAIGKSVVKDSLRARLDAQYLHSREDYPFEVNGESGERSASNPRIANGQMYLERHFRSGSRVQYFARGGYKRLTVPPAVVSGNLNAPGSELQQGDLWHFVRLSYDRSEHVFGEGQAFLKHRFQHLNYADRVSDSQYRLHHTTASYTTPLIQPRQSASAASDTTRSGGYHHRLKFNAQYKLYALKSEELFLGLEDNRSQTQRHLGAWALHYAGGATRFVNLDASARLSVANETVPVLPSVTLKLEKPIVKLPLVVVPYVYTAYSGRYPSFNELYFFGFGNPELPPEKRWQLSGGVAISGKRPDRLTVRTSVYHTRTIDRIIAVPLSPVRWSTRSFGLTKTLGGELSVNAKPWRWLPLMASANYQQARDYSLTDGNRLPYIPDWTFKAGATPTLRGWQLGVQTQAIGTRYPDVANRPQQLLSTAWLLNTWLQWRNNFKVGTLELRLAAENVTNTQYVLVNNFPMPSRRWRAQMTFVF